jgi:hypothetical protein
MSKRNNIQVLQSLCPKEKSEPRGQGAKGPRFRIVCPLSQHHQGEIHFDYEFEIFPLKYS